MAYVLVPPVTVAPDPPPPSVAAAAAAARRLREELPAGIQESRWPHRCQPVAPAHRTATAFPWNLAACWARHPEVGAGMVTATVAAAAAAGAGAANVDYWCEARPASDARSGRRGEEEKNEKENKRDRGEGRRYSRSIRVRAGYLSLSPGKYKLSI